MHIHVTRASSENGKDEGRGTGEREEERNKKRKASIIEIGRGGVPRMKLRLGPVISILNASMSASRSHEGRHEGGMKVPAIVLIRMRISIGIVLRIVERVLVDLSAMLRV